MFPVLAGSNPSGYNLTRSLRFRSSASAYLNRTYVASPTDYRKYTFSAWVKLGALGVSRRLIDAGSGSDTGLLNINSDGTLEFAIVVSGSGTTYLKTNNLLRDPSAWYHIVFSCDTSVGSNQFKFYVNNVQASYSTNTAITINYGTYLNSGSSVAQLGRSATYAQYFDGYMTEINFIDGQALTPSSFGSTNALTGVWQPAQYTGTYGTNGVYLPFTDNSALTTSSNVGLGKDFSGNGNYWVTNNISITAGVTYDSMTDVPTLTSATAANYCTWNPLSNTAGSLTNGNLTFNGTAGVAVRGNSTFAVSSGKWYFESTLTTADTFTVVGIGQGFITNQYPGFDALSYVQTLENATSVNNNVVTSYGSVFVAGDVFMCAFDLTNNKIFFGKNGTWFNSSDPAAGTNPAYTITAGTYSPIARPYGSGVVLNSNFGQRPFAYTPPTGFVALNAFNLPTSTIVKGNTVMDATLYTGNGSTQTITNAAGFRPDLVWDKRRDSAGNNGLFDSVRGAGNWISSNATNAETSGVNGVSAFNSNGFSVGSHPDYNTNAATQVAWQWQAGQGSTSTNTNGTITSTVSVNATAGFSVVTYTGNSTAGATVGHGLGVAPSFIIVKCRNFATEWYVKATAISGASNNALKLQSTDAVTSAFNYWNSTAPTSTVFTLGNDGGVNGAANYVAYCWTPITGFSAFGSYTGNGSTNGAFIYTGFRPRFVLVKQTDAAGNWIIWDTARSTYNQMQDYLVPNSSGAELNNVLVSIDAVSNGFKCRTADDDINGNGNTYIYMAFAESPFRNSLAR